MLKGVKGITNPREQPQPNRFEGIIDGTINGNFSGILRGLVNLTVKGTTDERLATFAPIFSMIWNQNQPIFSWVYISIPQKNLFYQYPWNANYNKGSYYYILPNYYPPGREWFPETFSLENASIAAGHAKGTQNFWTSLILDANTAKIGINLAQVIYDKEGQVVGPLCFGMYINEMLIEIINTLVAKTGYAFVIDQEGFVMISPELGAIERNTTSHEISLASGGIYNKSHITEVDPGFASLVENMTHLQAGVGKITLTENQTVYAAFAPILSPKWCIIVLVAEEEIIQPAIKTGKTITDSILLTELLFLALFILSIIISVTSSILLANSITKPIEELTEASERISKGDFQIQISYLTKQNELGILARSFDRMRKSLLYLLKKAEQQK